MIVMIIQFEDVLLLSPLIWYYNTSLIYKAWDNYDNLANIISEALREDRWGMVGFQRQGIIMHYWSLSRFTTQSGKILVVENKWESDRTRGRWCQRIQCGTLTLSVGVEPEWAALWKFKMDAGCYCKVS